MKTIADEITELRSMSVPELVTRYEATHGKPPRVKHREWLWRRIAWRIQEQRFGGLSQVAKQRLDELIADLDVPLTRGQRTVSGAIPKPGMPTVGTVLTRMWRGTEIRATVVDGGIEHDGVVYGSLSAAAKAITGAHWNGKLFFGLTQRKKARS